MKKLMSIVASMVLLVSLVGCQGNANLYDNSASVTPQNPSVTPKPECPVGECQKGCMLPVVKDHVIGGIVGSGYSAGECNVCIDTLEWDMLSDDSKTEVEQYIKQHGGTKRIADGAKIVDGACEVPEPPTETVCKFPGATNYNEPMTAANKFCCTLNYCNDPAYEEYVDPAVLLQEYKDFYASLVPSEMPQAAYDVPQNSLCKTLKPEPTPPEICAIEDVVCLPYNNDNSASTCDPAQAATFRGSTSHILKNDHDTEDRPFSFEEIFYLNDAGDKVVITNSEFIKVGADGTLEINECIPHKKVSYRICLDDPMAEGKRCADSVIQINRKDDCICTVCTQ